MLFGIIGGPWRLVLIRGFRRLVERGLVEGPGELERMIRRFGDPLEDLLDKGGKYEDLILTT